MNPPQDPAQIRSNAYLRYIFRRKFYGIHNFRMDYNHYTVTDLVARVNPNYLGGGNTSTNYFTLLYEFSYDLRDSKIYPLEGFLIKLTAKQTGLNFVPSFPYSFMSLTRSVNVSSKIGQPALFL